jgi:hypothetical protein
MIKQLILFLSLLMLLACSIKKDDYNLAPLQEIYTLTSLFTGYIANIKILVNKNTIFFGLLWTQRHGKIKYAKLKLGFN